MSNRPPLRAVKSGETAEPRKRAKTVAQAAAGGNHRELLVSMRERIARTVSDAGCPPRDLAALTRRLQEISKEIDAIDLRSRQESDEGGGEAEDEAWDSSAI